MTRLPNDALIALIERSGASTKSLARRINELTADSQRPGRCTHTSVRNWSERGMTPRSEIVDALARALAERLGRPVTAADMGMDTPARRQASLGLDFPREPSAGIRGAAQFWSTVDRRRA